MNSTTTSAVFGLLSENDIPEDEEIFLDPGRFEKSDYCYGYYRISGGF